MKSRIFNSQNAKKNIQSCKNKSKSKTKKKKNDLIILNMKLNLTDVKNISGKKNKLLGKDQTTSTNLADKSINSSIKVRSRSTQQQYKKILGFGMTQIRKTNITKMITEQDNIQFTQITPRQYLPQVDLATTNKKKTYLSCQRATIIIQRAWRKYQTLKLMKRYQRYFVGGLKSSNKTQKDNSQNLDLQRTLKIKKKNDLSEILYKVKTKNNQSPTQQQDEVDLIRRQILELKKNYNQDSLLNSPINNLFKNENLDKQTELKIKIKIQQQKKYQEIMKLIQKQSKNNSKSAIQKILMKVQNNKLQLQKNFNQRLQNIDSYQKQVQSYLNQLSSNNSKISLGSHQQMQHDINDKNIQQEQITFGSYKQSQIFQMRLIVLKQKKQIMFKKIQQQLIEKKINQKQALKKKNNIQIKYQRQKRKTQKTKKIFQLSLNYINSQALLLQKDRFSMFKFESNYHQNIRKSFSSQSVIFKHVLKEINYKQINYAVNNNICKKQIDNNNNNAEKNNLSNITKLGSYSQTAIIVNLSQNGHKIEQEIYNQIIKQMTYEIFQKTILYNRFRPYIQQVFEFKKIQDNQIFQFIQNLESYYPDKTVLKNRLNQKINPNSLQILKIIRNYDYQAQQYDLVLNEVIFKNAKINIEQKYDRKKKLLKQKFTINYDKIQNDLVKNKIIQITKQKQEKFNKYYNFERDLYIMYMKGVFNCLNELLIEQKTILSFMNTRSSIGPGELSLSIKDFNKYCSKNQVKQIFQRVKDKLKQIIRKKCHIPLFTNFREVQQFQQQIMRQLQKQLDQTQYKWVNFMDQILEIWQDISLNIQNLIINELISDIIQIIL